jgi:large repetitive protein
VTDERVIEISSGNTGNVPLANVVVTDDMLGPIAGPVTGDANNNGLLDLTETWFYIATTTAGAGQQTNLGTVIAQDAGTTVTDENPANYFGDIPGITFVKLVNGQDADIPTGPHVAAGSTVIFTYMVANTGNVPLGVSLIDDKLGPITSFMGDANGDSLLDLTETWTYTQTATALAGQQTNTGIVTGVDANTFQTVTVSNVANYFGDAPAINIVKFVNGEDADSPTGPHVAADSTLTFTYVVVNTGNVPLANVAVTDDMLGLITSFTGDTDNNGLLDLTETWTYTQTATALAGQQTNLGTVTAEDANNPPGTTVTDDNPANYFGEGLVDLRVTKDDGMTAVVPGMPVTYTIVVANNGPSTVSSVILVDEIPLDALLEPAFGPPSAGSYDPVSGLWSGLSLASGQSVSITLSGTIEPIAIGELTNTVVVLPPAGVTDPNLTDNTFIDTDFLPFNPGATWDIIA